MDLELRRGIFVFLVAAFAATGAHADPAGVNGREQFQRDRIRAGVQDGSLTRPEARHLATQQRRTERLEQRMRRDDGVLGPRERARLDQRLDRSSANIYRARHDGQSR
jgi:hypothetical protein